jgi:hypothetical protein
MPTVNQQLADESIAHAEALQRYANRVVALVVALLNRGDADLSARLAEAMERLPAESFSVQRLESLLSSVRELNAAAYRAAVGELTKELRDLAEYEAGHQLALFQATIPPQVVTAVGVAAVVPEQAYAAAMARPFQGRLLSEWAASMEEGRMVRVRDAVRMGYVQQESIGEIVRRIRGTRARGYADGLLEIDRRHAEAVVRTAVSHTAGYVREQFFGANTDLVKAQEWVSTLDTKTSEICLLRDGKQYQPVSPYKPIGHSLTWLGGPGRAHWQCRSAAVPVVKSWRELGADMPEFDGETRASMDGQVAQDMNYGDWLKRQPRARQISVLGETRARLLRDGGLTVDKFATDKGRWLTLEELKQLDADAFKRAGL